LLLTLRYLGGADPNQLALEYCCETENSPPAQVAVAANHILPS
jgi:hypothetical protein